MTTKLFELRDEGTFIPVIAVQLNPRNEQERYLCARSGYGRTPEAQRGYVLLAPLQGGHRLTYDPFGHESRGRTVRTAHQYIIEHFDELDTGSVIDVEVLLGLRAEPKLSEARL